MAVTFVTSNSVEGSTIWSDSSETLAVSVQAGDYVVAMGRMQRSDRTLNVATDDNSGGSNTYTIVSGAKVSNASGQVFMQFARAQTTQTLNVTTTWSGADGANNGEYIVAVFRGCATSQPSQVSGTHYRTNSVTGTASHGSNGTVAPNPTSNNVMVAIFGHSGTTGWTYDTDFTGEVALTANDIQVFYRLDSPNATESYAATSDVNRDSACILQMLEGAAAAGSPNVRRYGGSKIGRQSFLKVY